MAYHKCVYTIVKGHTLDEIVKSGGSGELTQGKKWTKASELCSLARMGDQNFLIVFAPTEDNRVISHHADLEDIAIDHKNNKTTFRFSKLTPCVEQNILKTDLVAETGINIPEDHTRSYVVCRTPPVLLSD